MSTIIKLRRKPVESGKSIINPPLAVIHSSERSPETLSRPATTSNKLFFLKKMNRQKKTRKFKKYK